MSEIQTVLQPQEEETASQEQAPFFSRLKQGLRAGAADASRAVEQTFSTLGQAASKAVYSACYGVSYGVTFVALGAARVLPETVLRGFKDGAEAAEQLLEGKSENSAETAEQPA